MIIYLNINYLILQIIFRILCNFHIFLRMSHLHYLTIYLYALAGEPWKCADKVREVLQTLYFDGEAGLSGNEDVGQMSAWYVMSAMGLYEVEPAGARYWFGSPTIDKAELKVKGGEFTIIAENNSEQNKYIQRVWLNGKEYRKPWISHSDLIAGGELRFEMGQGKKLWY